MTPVRTRLFIPESVLVLMATALIACGARAEQTPEPESPSARTELGLYVTARQAWSLLQTEPAAILVDVRDPVEAMFTGFADPTQVHVPWLIVDPRHFSPEHGRYEMSRNPRFDQDILERLQALEVARDAPIIVICRSGATRSAPAADRLTELGFTRVYSVVDGFEGERLRDGDSAGVRALNGWRNSGLPWSYTLPEDVAYRLSPPED